MYNKILLEKNDNKKKSQVIQHLHGISEVNHLHDDLSRPIFFLWRITQELV